jgi:hypothetical protein
MAKKDTTADVPTMEPRAHVSWGHEDLKASGLEAAGMDKTVTVTLTGKVKGWSMYDHGCSLDLEPSAISITAAKREKDGPSMVDIVKGMGKKVRKGEE